MILLFFVPSVRRGCSAVSSRTFPVAEDDPAKVFQPLGNGHTYASKVVWTDYETALLYVCLGNFVNLFFLNLLRYTFILKTVV